MLTLMIPDKLKIRLKRILKRLNRSYLEIRNANVSPGQIMDTLRKLGVREGDVIFVHSSFDKMRGVDGGVRAIVDGLLDVVGEKGTLAMPSFPASVTNKEYLDRSPLFDASKTPSRMGLITEVFRRWPGVERSIHPTHSVVAKGPRAKWLVEGHERSSDPFGEGTPFHKLTGVNGKVVLLGVGIGALTHIHVAEAIMGNEFPVQVYLQEPKVARIVDSSGVEREINVRVHAPEVSKRRDIRVIEKYLVKADRLKRKRIGGISVSILDANDLANTLVDLARKGITAYKRPK